MKSTITIRPATPLSGPVGTCRDAALALNILLRYRAFELTQIQPIHSKSRTRSLLSPKTYSPHPGRASGIVIAMSDLETFVVATGSIHKCAYSLSPDHLPDRRTLAELLVGVGQTDALVPVVRDLEAVPGDLYGLGLLHPDQVRALREDGTRRLDRALARCALSPTVRHFPLLLARWGHSPTEAPQGQVADGNAAPVSS